MNEQRGSSPTVEDEEIGRLVRDLAGGWEAGQDPDLASWRDRIESGWGRTGPRWPRRILSATSWALVATVALALAAVLLTGPGGPMGPGGPSVSPPAGSPSAMPPTVSAGPTPLPTVATFGAALPPTRLLIETGTGYAFLDVRAGTLGERLASSDSAQPEVHAIGLFPLPGGSVLCVCGVHAYLTTGGDRVAVELRTFAGDGTVTSVRQVGAYASTPTASATIAGTLLSAALSPDGTTAFVGWSEQQASAWRSGIDAVAVGGGTLAPVARLPDLPLTAGALPADLRPSPSPGASPADAVYAWAPSVVVSLDYRLVAARRVVVDSNVVAVQRYFVDVPAAPGTLRPVPTNGNAVPMTSGPGSLGAPECLYADEEAFASESVYVAICGAYSGQTILRRVGLDGRPLGDTPLPDAALYPFGGWATVPAIPGSVRRGAAGYAWSPSTRTLLKVDLASGAVLATATLPAAQTGAVESGPLAAAWRAIGDWLAPGAAAKTYLDPAIAVSPDGSRLYLLDTTARPENPEGGSTGIWVVDAGSLRTLAHWTATADYTSIGVSGDGALVYAAGAPGVDASGSPAGLDASVTVFDAATGRVRAIDGRLGQDDIRIRGVLAP